MTSTENARKTAARGRELIQERMRQCLPDSMSSIVQSADGSQRCVRCGLSPDLCPCRPPGDLENFERLVHAFMKVSEAMGLELAARETREEIRNLQKMLPCEVASGCINILDRLAGLLDSLAAGKKA